MPSVMATTSSSAASTPSRMASARERRRDEDRAGGRAGLFHGFGDGVKDRDLLAAVLEELAALAGRDAGDDLRAVIDGELGMPRAEAAGDALNGVGFREWPLVFRFSCFLISFSILSWSMLL
jgi:hypothetical protein